MTLTVLVVADDAMARNEIERAVLDDKRLRPLSPRVVHAANGEEGLAVFVRDRPEVVVAHLIATGMDGLELSLAIREARFGQRVGLVVISPSEEDASLAISLAQKVHATLLPKSFTRTDLIDAILATSGLVANASSQFEEGGTLRFGSPAPLAKPSPSGLLKDRGIAGLIFELADSGQTGTLALARGKVRKEIYLREGRVVAADSNLRQEALGTLLCAKGVIDEHQLAYLLAETKARGHKMGAVLIELGWLSPEEVLQCLVAQANKRIADCLRWDEGTWRFVPGDGFGERVIEHDLDIERTIFMGLMHTADPERLARRFDENGARPIRLAARFERHRSAFETVFGADIVMSLSTGATVGSLALHDDAQLIIAAIDVLLESGLAELDAPLAEPTETEALPDWPSPLSLEKLGSEANRRIESGGDEMFSQISQSPSPAPEVPREFMQPMDDQESGEMDVGLHAYTTAGRQASPAHASQATRQAIMRALVTIRGKPLREALSVPANAPDSEILAAISAMMAEFAPERMADVDLSPSDQTALQSLRAALTQAAQSLTIPQPPTDHDRASPKAMVPEVDALGAELAFGEGMQLFEEDRLVEAVSKFELAVRARPDQALYQAYLGWTKFVAYGSEHARTAREALKLALSIDPDLAEAHAMLGRLAATENDAATARDHLQRSLELRPEQPDTVDLLLEAYRRLDDPKGAEAFLRRLVAALRERARPLRERLWRELALIYEQQLDDRLSARIAYDTAARLAPTDIDIVRKSAALNAEDPSRWREMASAILAEWNLHPQDVSAGQRLLDLFARQNHTEAVTITAAAMVLRGAGGTEVVRLANAGRKTELPRWPDKMPAHWVVRLGSPSEFIAVEDLLTLLVESGVIPATSLGDLGLDEREALVTPDRQPGLFRSILASLCSLLDIANPRVMWTSAFANDAAMVPTRPPSLLCGLPLLEQTDPVELGFRLSRALAKATAGRLAGTNRSGGQLRPYFMAALASARGTLHSEDPVFAAAQAHIAGLAAPLRTRIAEGSQQLVRQYGSINLSAWTRSLSQVAARLSLLLCGDLLRVGSALGAEEGQAARDYLISFALSFDYLDLRDEFYACASPRDAEHT